MLLNVPLISQRPGSFHCQVATTLMILEYFNDSMSYDELLIAMHKYFSDGGIHSQGPALFFQERGYNTFFGNHDLGVIDSTLENCTEKDVLKFKDCVNSLEESEKNAYRITKLKLDIEYMESGGKYSTFLSNFDLVDKYLHKSIPVNLCAVRAKALHLNPTWKEGCHSILIVGKDGDNYIINDPSPRTLGQYSINKDRLLHAWYNSGAQIRIVSK